MSRAANRSAAAQMERDGISKLRVWSKPVRIGCADFRQRIQHPDCTHPGCKVMAKYQTPAGVRCFKHAIKGK